MNPLALLSLIQALGGLGGMFLHDSSESRYGNLLKLIKEQTSPGNIAAEGQKLYDLSLRTLTPARTAIQARSQATASQLAGALARSGLSSSVIGSIAPILAQAGGGTEETNLLSNTYQSSLDQASKNIFARFGLAGRPGEPKFQFADQYGGFLKSLGDLGPLLDILMKGKKPAVTAVGGGGTGPWSIPPSAPINEQPWTPPVLRPWG